MKKNKIVIVTLVFMLIMSQFTTVFAAGIRNALEHSQFVYKVTGASFNVNLPSSSNINDVYINESKRVHPEVFAVIHGVKPDSKNKNETYYDGGILKYDGEWHSFLYSSNTYKDSINDGALSISDGDTVSVKLVAENGYVNLYINGVVEESVRSSFDVDGVWKTCYEANIVPAHAIKDTDYMNLADNGGVAKMNHVEITSPTPIKSNGQALTSNYFKSYNYVLRSEDSQYSDSVARKVTTVYYDLKQYFYSSMDFNKY